MAATIPVNCVKCNKNGGILLCNGCNQYLCFEHVNQHRNEIEQNLEDLIRDEDQFEKDLSNSDDKHLLFGQIDQWKKESIEQIKQIAKKAKEDLRELLKQSHENILKDLTHLRENIHLLKESNDLSEIQLNKLINRFNQFKSKINSFQLIKSTNSNYLQIMKQKEDELPPPPSGSKPLDSLLPHIEQNHSKKEGSIIISEVDRYGNYIKIEHNGFKDQDMCGWIFKRTVDPYGDFIYRFPNDFILTSKSSVKILSRLASQSIYAFEPGNILIAKSIETWGIGGFTSTTTNRLLDPNGDEKDVLIEIRKL